MIKTKYYYDKESLSYKKVQFTKVGVFKTASIYLLPILSLCVIICIIILSFFSTPKEISLQKEIKNLTAQYEEIEKKIISVEKELNTISQKDKQIRTILESEPISDDIRKAGFGGIDRYQKFKNYQYSDLIISIHKKADEITRKLGVQSQSFDDIITLAKNHSNKILSIPAIQPISNKDLSRVSSGFGYRIDPHYRIRKMHAGIDFAAPRGTPVYATGNGKVIKAIKRSRGGYGKYIILDHGHNFKTQYAHLNRLAVQEGQIVKRGQLIGYVGSTGKSTSPHLHYEVHINDKKVNPIDYFYDDLTIQEYDEMRKMCTKEQQSLD